MPGLTSLHIEASTAYGGVCLLQEGDVRVFSKESFQQRSHSEFIHPAVQHVLSESGKTLQDIDFFGCGIGPGSFTGTRIAVNTLKTYAYLSGKPLVPVTSLEALAFQNKKRSGPQFALTLINAYKNMVYYNFFDLRPATPLALVEDGAIFVRHLDQVIKPTAEFWIVGDGFGAYEKYLPASLMALAKRPVATNDSDLVDYPSVLSTGSLAALKFKNQPTKDWISLQPLYIRASEAEENKRGITYIPL